MWKASYAMWQDHKVLGAGLENWQKEYAGKYILKDEIKREVRQQYLDWKKEEEKRIAATKKEALDKAANLKTEAEKKAAAK